MKKGWTYKKLGEVFKTYAGGTPSKANKANYINGTIPWLRSGEVCKKYITESELYISEEGLRNSSAKYYPINTVLIAMYGATAAQCGILKFEATSNQAVCGVLPQKDFLPEFVYSYFVYIKDALAAQAQGGAQPNISQEKIKNVYFPCIPLSEQKLIVSRLDAAFSHIDELKANAEKQLSEARALFQKSLAKAMEPKEGWGERKFKDLCSFVRGPFGGSLKKEMFVVSGYAVYEQQNAIYNRFNFRYFIDEEKYNSMIRFSVSPGDLIMSCSGTIGKVAIIPDDAAQGIINQALLKLTPKKILDKYYLKYLMESSFFGDLISQYSDGAAIKNIASVAILKDIVLPLPSLSEQQRIVERLDALSAHVRDLEENQKKIISECDALKQALLRKVFE